MRLKHREENAPATYRGHGVTTEPGDELIAALEAQNG